MRRPRLDVNLEELDRVLDQARQAPLSEPDYEKLKGALHALAGMLPPPRTGTGFFPKVASIAFSAALYALLSMGVM